MTLGGEVAGVGAVAIARAHHHADLTPAVRPVLPCPRSFPIRRSVYLLLAAASSSRVGLVQPSNPQEPRGVPRRVAFRRSRRAPRPALFESPREEAVRRVEAMAKAADVRTTRRFVAHLADKVEYRGADAESTLTARATSQVLVLEPAEAVQRPRRGVGLLAKT